MDKNGVPYIKDHIPKYTKKRRPGYPLKYKKVCVHSTGNPTSKARGERGWLINVNNTDPYTGAHIFVDDAEAVEAIPLDEAAWHAGDGPDGKGNREAVSVEICHSGNRARTLLNAAKVVAWLLTEGGLTIDDMTQHYDYNKKNCPSILRANGGKGWQEFVESVRVLMEGEEPNPLEAAIQTLTDAGIITSPEYWRLNAETGRFVKGEFVGSLILKMAEKLRR